MKRVKFWWHLYIPMMIFLGVLFSPGVKVRFAQVGERWLYILATSFVVSFCMTPIFGWIAERLGILDIPDERKVHKDPTPLLGGCAVFLGITVSVAANGICGPVVCRVISASMVLLIAGAVDDRLELSAFLKLVVQLGAVFYVMDGGLLLRVFPDSMGIAGIVGNLLFTVVWIVGITNAMNFFDGMDGLAAGISVVIAFFMGWIAYLTGQPDIGWLAVAVMGASLGFLPYNLRKGRAVIFLGDGGSTVLGFILACIAVHSEWSSTNPVVALVSPLLIFWILIFDMVHITIDRILTGKVKSFREWLEFVGKDHLHHRLADVLGSPKLSVFFIYVLSIALGISAVVLQHASSVDALLLVTQAFILVCLITVLERFGRMNIKTGNDGD